jgi:polyketide synthase 12/myxalamid-type polyketide synthase MxaB
LTAPNPQAQEQVIRAALADAGLTAKDVSYIEAHGTGTTLGDPIEMQALGTVFGPGRGRDQPLMVGSVKTNIGHLEAAAGIAGLVKVILALQHRIVPPHLHFDRPNPYIPWNDLPIAVPTRPTDWLVPDGGRRIAGLSSFGFSGTNAHLIVGEPPAPLHVPTELRDRPAHLLVLSARTDTALHSLVEAVEAHLGSNDGSSFPDICFTAATGRSHFPERLAVVASTSEEARAKLAAFRAAQMGVGAARGAYHHADPPGVVFLFSGQGSQYPGMGESLYRAYPVFRATIDRCAAVVDPLIGRPLLSVLFPADGAEPSAIDDTLYTQPALFAFEYALAQLWLSWGMKPAAVMGHSLGEYVAACVAGVMSVEAALTVVAARARLMDELPRGGAMAAVLAPVNVVRAAVGETTGVAIAAVNGPRNVVISGPQDSLARVTRALTARGVASKALTVSHAFHSSMMDAMLPSFGRVLNGVEFTPAEIDVISNANGRVAGPEIGTAEYWVQHVRRPVEFARSIETAVALGYKRFLEIGPSPVLLGMGAQCVAAPDVVWAASMRRGQEPIAQLLLAAATLFTHGTDLDWAAFEKPWPRRRVVLPTYPFERSRHWLALPQASRRRHTVSDAHPLLGDRVRSPRLGATVFQSEVSADTPAFLSEHRIFDRVVMPATAYLEMAAAAGTRVFGSAAMVTDVSVREPLVLDGETCLVQTILDQSDDDDLAVEIYSFRPGSDEWRLHVVARVGRGGGGPLSDAPTGGELTPIDARECYEALAHAGVAYGPRFRLLDDVQVGGGYAAATLRSGPDEPDSPYLAHPAIVDAALQLAGAALLEGAPNRDSTTIYLPVAAATFEVVGPLAGPLRATAHVTPVAGGHETFVGGVTITAQGVSVVRVQDITFKRATSEAVRRAVERESEGALFEVTWDDLSAPVASNPDFRRWLILTDRTGVGAALGAQLRAAGDTVSCVPYDQSDVDALTAALAAAGETTDVVHCWSLDIEAAASDDRSLAMMRQRGCVTLVNTVQALAQVSIPPPRLTVVTRGAQAATIEGEDVAVTQSAIWGLGRTLRNEHPELQCKLVDLSPLDADGVNAQALLTEVLAADRREGQVALRSGRRLGPRLVRVHGRGAGVERLAMPASVDVTLDIAERGVLDRLRVAPLTVEPPRAGEIQIAVAASGLNFRDVLSALGMYPGEPGPLGGEVVGSVVARGAGVRDFEIGDQVMALTPRGFCSRVNTSARLAWRLPAGLSVADAATIPVAFQTAYYALHHVAQIVPGERVLIHAGSGGVGLAAIQLAQAAGAIVFATAGTDAKRDLLRSLGVTHVMDSRSLTFADAVRADTGGEGIDVVVNSLAGDFIPASLRLLRERGRFVELGKTDLWDQTRVSAVNPHARFTAMYLGDVCASSPDLIHDIFERLMPMFARGELRPLMTRTFAIDDAQAAFRYMAQARHVGKVVIEQRRFDERKLIHGDGAYIVTGGLGGVGLKVADWLSGGGARRVVLAGRRRPDEATATAIDALRRRGTDVVVVTADVARQEEALRLVVRAEEGGVRLRGIVHAAGQLDDGVTLQQSDERFARVFGAKVAGAWWTYLAGRERDLDFLVFCSAGAALFGAPGQGNYAAANAYLDALAWHARRHGVPALSVNWGPWRDTGMMTGVSTKDKERWAAQGMGQLDPAMAIESLDTALRRGLSQVAVLEMDWSRVAGGPDAPAPFLSQLVQASKATHADEISRVARGAVRRQLEELPPEDRAEHLAAHVRDQVRRVLGLGEAVQIPGDRGFSQLGMDSLMSVELSNRLRESLGCQLSTTLGFEHPTVTELTTYLTKHVLQLDPHIAATAASHEVADPARVRMLATVEHLDEEEAERSLAEELDRAGY